MATTPWTTKPPLGSQINWSHPLSKGLVGCWLMNEGGGNKVIDIAKNISLPLTACVFNNRDRGGGVKFNGTSSYIGTGASQKYDISTSGITFVSSFVLDGWGESNYGRLVCVTNPDFALDAGFSVFISNSYNGYTNTFFGNNHGNANAVNAASNTLSLGKSATIAYTSFTSGTSARFFIDGKESVGDAVQANYVSCVDSVPVILLGKRSDNARYFNGVMFYAYYYNRVLSPSEIKSLYESPYQFIEYRSWTIWGAFTEVVAGAVQNLRNAIGQGIGSGISQGAR